MAARLKNGVMGAPGGRRDNSGRKPDWLKEKCRKLVSEKNLVGFLAKVASGENFEQVINSEGDILPLPAPLKERLKAVEILLDRGFGKVPQALEHTGEITQRRIVCIKTEKA